MNLNQQNQFPISQNISADLKDQKENIICTTDDDRGDFLLPPHDTTTAAVIANKNKTDPLRAANILMRKGWVIPHME